MELPPAVGTPAVDVRFPAVELKRAPGVFIWLPLSFAGRPERNSVEGNDGGLVESPDFGVPDRVTVKPGADRA